MLFTTVRIGGVDHPAARVNPAEILICETMQKERDSRYGNLFEEKKTDRRSVGELGELAFHTWLDFHGIEHEWLVDHAQAAGAHDFLVGGKRIGIKAIKRQCDPLPHYTMQISEHHKDEPVDSFFFLSFNWTTNLISFLGGASRSHFLKNATHHGPGSKVHSNYTVRPGHAIRNIEIRHLIHPSKCIRKLARSTGDIPARAPLKVENVQLSVISGCYDGASHLASLRTTAGMGAPRISP